MFNIPPLFFMFLAFLCLKFALADPFRVDLKFGKGYIF